MISTKWLVVVVMLATIGCAEQKTSVVRRGGCEVDLKKICSAYFSQPQFTLNGQEYDATRLEQNSRRHENIELPYKYPNGDLIATVECQVDTSNRTISYARLVGGPPIDEKAVAYVRSQGLCADQSPDYGKMLTIQQQEITPSATPKN